MRELATPLPVIAILELLGLDPDGGQRHHAARDRRRRARPAGAHLGFGTHFCLGASLARLELRVVFEELLRRLPELRLAPGARARWVPNAFTRGLAALPLEFAPGR